MRLIDADKLIEDLEKVKKESESLVDLSHIIGFQSVVDAQPTAFDVEKVVEQLDNLRKEYKMEANNINIPHNYSCYYKGHMRGYEHSIDIVKRGVIDENIWI